MQATPGANRHRYEARYTAFSLSTGWAPRLRLVGHLGWVHRQEASAVGQPRERMGGRRERRSAG